MAEHSGADRAARPVMAGPVFTSRERTSVGLGAGENVMHVRFVAAGVDGLALLAKRSFFADLIVVAVQIVDIFRDGHAFGVLSRAFADAIAGVDGGITVGGARAQVRTPGAIAGADGLGKRLAMFIGPRETAKVGTLSGTDAGDEKSHAGVFLLRAGDPVER